MDVLTDATRGEHNGQGLSSRSSLRSKVRNPISGPICLAYRQREVLRKFDQNGREPGAKATPGFKFPRVV